MRGVCVAACHPRPGGPAGPGPGTAFTQASPSLCLLGEQRIMRSLHTVVFGEYVQALATHLRTLEPGTWEGLGVQVETDTRKLHDIFTKHGVSRGRSGRLSAGGLYSPFPVLASPGPLPGLCVLSSLKPQSDLTALGLESRTQGWGHLLSRQRLRWGQGCCKLGGGSPRPPRPGQPVGAQEVTSAGPGSSDQQ